MFKLIAGPCVIESEEMVFSIAKQMKDISDKLGIHYTFKASFDKANRTSINSFRGPGIVEGLRILKKVKDTFHLPICTRQTDLLVAAAKTGKCINIKKAQFLAPWDMKNCIEKVRQSGNDNVMICERGTTFGYNTLVVDMTGLRVMKDMGVPVIFDATHSVQKPGGNGSSTGGNRQYVEYIAKAAVAVGVDGLFMETHTDPDNAKSDGPNMVPLGEMEILLKKLQKVYEAVNES